MALYNYDQTGRNASRGDRHVRIVVAASQIDTDADGRVTIVVPQLRQVHGAKVDTLGLQYNPS